MERQEDNDLFYTCSLIEYIARITKNKKSVIVSKLGRENIEKMVKSGLIVPARIDASKSKYFLDGQKPKNAKVFLEVIKTSKPTPVSVNYNEVIDKVKVKNEKLLN